MGTSELMDAEAARIDHLVCQILADYVNRDGWTDGGAPHTPDSFRLVRQTVGLDHLVAIQWGHRVREQRFPSYPEVSLERRGEAGLVLKVWAEPGKAHSNRSNLPARLHEATDLPTELYGDFMASKDPEKNEAWRAYRTVETRLPE